MLTYPRSSFQPYPSHLRSRPLVKPTGWSDNYRRMLPGPSREEQFESEILTPEQIDGRRRINYDVIMLWGKRGDGKTAAAVALALQLKRIWKNIGCNNRIFSNFHLDFADMAHPRLVDEIVTFPSWCHDCLIIIDEIASFIPSQRGMSNATMFFTMFLQQVRKIRASIIFTTQYPTYIGAGSNIQINWYIKPYRFNSVYNRKLRAYVSDSMRLDIVDYNGAQTGYPVMHPWPPREEDINYTRYLHGLSRIYEMYDTDEVIPPFASASRERMIEQNWADEIAKEEASDKETQETLKAAREAAQQAREEPTSLEALLAIQPDEFRVSDLLDIVPKRIDKSLNDIPKILAAIIRVPGWTTENRSGNVQWAVRRK